MHEVIGNNILQPVMAGLLCGRSLITVHSCILCSEDATVLREHSSVKVRLVVEAGTSAIGAQALRFWLLSSLRVRFTVNVSL